MTLILTATIGLLLLGCAALWAAGLIADGAEIAAFDDGPER